MAEPLVSIVLPTYNGERYLDQSIASCRSQSYPAWELIVVDDASTDGTPRVIADHSGADQRVRSVRHPINRRLPRSLNTGFAEARGQYLTWTSDDNLYRPTALAEMVSFLESRREVDVVYTDYSEIDEAGEPLGVVAVPLPSRLVEGNCIGPCFLYREHVQVGLGGYAEDLFLAEDYDFWLRAATAFRLEPLHRDLYLYRRHSASLTEQRAREVGLRSMEALERSLPRLRWLDRRSRAQGYLRLASAAQARHEDALARHYLLVAAGAWPLELGRGSGPRFVASVLLGSRVSRALKRARQGFSRAP